MSENTNRTEYVQVRVPDKELVGRLVNDAKGPNRTMADFATACGISASTMSRIVNAKGTGAISMEALKRIYQNRAETCSYEFAELAAANGMMNRDRMQEMQHQRIHDRQREIMNRRRSMKNIITSELFVRGVQIRQLPLPNNINEALRPALPFSRYIVCDLAIGIEEDETGSLEWGFSILPSVIDSDDDERDISYVLQRFLQRNSAFFLQDAWQPEELRGQKISFAFCDQNFYNRFVDAMKVAKLNNRFSAILLDVNAEKVVDETIFPCKMFNQVLSLFSLPVHDRPICDDRHFGFEDFIYNVDNE